MRGAHDAEVRQSDGVELERPVSPRRGQLRDLALVITIIIQVIIIIITTIIILIQIQIMIIIIIIIIILLIIIIIIIVTRIIIMIKRAGVQGHVNVIRCLVQRGPMHYEPRFESRGIRTSVYVLGDAMRCDAMRNRLVPK